MRIFSQGHSTLGSFSLPMKLALSFFVVFVLLGLCSSVALYHQQFEFSTETASDYYRGNQGEKNVDTFYVPKPYPRLLEVTHFHLYITGLVYLALTHLYFLSGQSQFEKSLMTILAFLGLLTEILTPWLVRYGSGMYSSLFWVSGSLITVCTLWMSGICLWGLWLGTEN